jgi:ADP-ribose pyrophosphatase YjhB (NUDIX family)
MLDRPVEDSVDMLDGPRIIYMRHSELSLVLIRLKVNSEPHHVLIWHEKWHDWSFVGGHVESDEKNDWARAAVRECNEELTPLKYGQDFTLLPLLDQPLRWGPVPSKSAHDEPTMYTAQIFALRFLRPPAECLARLPVDEFCIVRESELINREQNSSALTVRAINKVMPTSLSWDSALSSLPLKSQTLSA